MSQTKSPFDWGPYLQMALFCERVLEEKDGALSAIRIVDRLDHTEVGPSSPEDMPVFNYALTLVVALKSGAARGRHDLTVLPVLPSGELGPKVVRTVQMEGENRGVNTTAVLDMAFAIEGVYWFKVLFDGVLLTKIPLEVRYSRLLPPEMPGQFG